jgi:site-specific recombinase XerD
MSLDTVQAIATAKAISDEQLTAYWVASFNSAHTRRNCESIAQRFLAALGAPLPSATAEDVREALMAITTSLRPTSARRTVLRVKSLLSYGRRLGYLHFNAGAVIRVQGDRHSIAQRIVGEVELGYLMRAVRGSHRVLVLVAYTGGLHVSELVVLTWGDVVHRDDGKVQLNVLGKGSKPRDVLLPEIVSNALLKLRGANAGAADPIFTNRVGGRLTDCAVNYMLKAAAARAGLPVGFSSHWLRQAHASHAIDGDATLPDVQAPLGHANVATTMVRA